MPAPDSIFESDIPGLSLVARGKVRDVYSIDDDHLLIVATDRLSAYDVVLPDPVPRKGEILTKISNFWFEMMADLVPNHLSQLPLESVVHDRELRTRLAARSTVVKRLRPLPVEAVVRGYLIGSGWRDYEATGSVCGIRLPTGLRQAEALPTTLFTPATKAPSGDHDENISFDEMCNLVGKDLATTVRDISLAVYERAVEFARGKGIIIADTKFEFGLDESDRLFIIDEILTPDSSRFWPSSEYREGTSPPSFDKQFVRDYLDTLEWDQTAPGPSLPEAVIRDTGAKYREAMQILTE